MQGLLFDVDAKKTIDAQCKNDCGTRTAWASMFPCRTGNNDEICARRSERCLCGSEPIRRHSLTQNIGVSWLQSVFIPKTISSEFFQSLTTSCDMDLELDLTQDFRIDDVEIRPLQQIIVTPWGARKVSKLAIAFLIQLALAPWQVISGAVLREHMGVDESADLYQCWLDLQRAFGDDPDAPRHIAYIGSDEYELLTRTSINASPASTTAQILNKGSGRAA